LLREKGNKYQCTSVRLLKEITMQPKQMLILISLMLSAIFLVACGTVNAMIVSAAEAASVPTPSPLSQVMDENFTDPLLDFEQARDLAVSYIAQRAGIPAPGGAWVSQDTTPTGLLGSSNVLYTLDPWVVQVSAPVVAPEQRAFTMVVDHMTELFRWEGSVDAYGNVHEKNFIKGDPAPQPGNLADMTDGWVGVVVSNPAGAQFDDYFQMLDQDGTRCGIDSLDASVRGQILSYRDTGKLIKVYGKMQPGIDAYGRQIVVTHLEEF
jgi:hypothetical protein